MSVTQWLAKAQAARDRAQWPQAIAAYQHLLAMALSPEQEASIHHNLGLSYLGAGQYRRAHDHAARALSVTPQLWQAAIVMAKAQKALGQIEQADRIYQVILRAYPHQPNALLGRADLAMNQLGDPLAAQEMTAILAQNPEYAMDAQLTHLMSRLYDREPTDSAWQLSCDIRLFAQEHLQLSPKDPRAPGVRAARDLSSARPRVALLSPHFHASPVYYLTIAGWRHVVKGCDLILFNRGHQRDWATDIFYEIAHEVHEVQHQDPWTLAQQISAAQIDVLYDLGGWMDPVGLQALSLKPASKQFKWVGGQSVTTGLDCFDGWIGDAQQSPAYLQKYYTEPLIQVPGGYAHYTPPDYLPRPARHKRQESCVFSNPAKVSRAFLKQIAKRSEPITFIHQQYRWPSIQARIQEVLGDRAHFVTPTSHLEALATLNEFETMLDTFPYSSGLTGREALAMNTRIDVLQVGHLFCERHSAAYRKELKPERRRLKR
jgi:predicted O-linked N-acetylglucosamine transferase (SPINDLY family)